MEVYPKIQTLFRRDMDGSLTGQKGKMIYGEWTTPELEYLANNEWEFTEKVDGTNIRVGCEGISNIHGHRPDIRVKFAGRTDNAVIPTPLMEYLEATFTKDLFSEADLKNVILFGEGYGPKIQGGGKYRSDHSFVLFDVKIGDWWLLRKDVNDIAQKLGIDSVPVVGTGTLWSAMNMVKTGKGRDLAGNVLDFSSSRWGDFEAEGIVARPVVPLFNRKGERIITKIKAVDFRG